MLCEMIEFDTLILNLNNLANMWIFGCMLHRHTVSVKVSRVNRVV